MASDEDIVIVMKFQNKFGGGSGRIRDFINDYMMRDDAVEPLIIDSNRLSAVRKMLTNLRSPKDLSAVKYLNQAVQYQGTGFDLGQVALDKGQMRGLADDAQKAYNHGASIRMGVISFKTSYLMREGLLDSHVRLPVHARDLYGKVDTQLIREAVQDGMGQMLDTMDLKQPKLAAAVQFDREQVHIHFCLWDQDKSAVDDRGMISKKQFNLFRLGFQQSLDNSYPYMNNLNDLRQLASLTQSRARMKQELLGQQLDGVARLDTDLALDSYIASLADFDGRTISKTQRYHMRNRIRADLVRQGRVGQLPRNLTPERLENWRRYRRKMYAERSAVEIGRQMRIFNRQAAWGQVSTDAMVVKDALDLEMQRSMMAVDKYRHLNRNQALRIYQNKQGELTRRCNALLKQREQLIRNLGLAGIRSSNIQRILKSPRYVQAILHDNARENQHDLSSSSVYQNLKQAEADSQTPLSFHSLHVLRQTTPKAEQSTLLTQLTRNQRVQDLRRLSDNQRRELFLYLADLDDYETDLTAWSGRRSEKARPYLDQRNGLIPEPETPKDIYTLDRERSRQDFADLRAANAQQILSSGPLKPEIRLALVRQMKRRQQVLLRAANYFKQTQQTRPDWLTDAMQDLVDQYQLMRNSTAQSVKLKEPKTMHVDPITDKPRELTPETRNELVQKHLKQVDGLVL